MADRNQEIWNGLYEQGRMLNRYPWDVVVSFLFKHGQKGQKVLELGCGSGSNLWFAAREGFKVVGTDFSQASLDYAKARFAQENLAGEFIHSGFPEVPVAENSIDLAIDRAALCCISKEKVDMTLKNLQQSLKQSGKFLSQAYTTKHSTYYDSSKGSVSGVGELCFLSQAEVEAMYSRYFNLLSIEERVHTQIHPSSGLVHSEWIITCSKN